MRPASVRTWVEISRRAAEKNCDLFRRLVGPRTKLWAVVKSNAYGHGLWTFAHLVNAHVDGFCVDSALEGIALRDKGITKPILVLGPTLPALLPRAAMKGITLSISNFDALKAMAPMKHVPAFHIKIDSGMHRQGFYPEAVPAVIRFLGAHPKMQRAFEGVFTHFASAKDVNYPTYTELQFRKFTDAANRFHDAGYETLVRHAAATGGTLLDKKYHLDAVRVGIGLYGLWPSKELEVQLPQVRLHPVLSWRTVVSEVKELIAGDYVGYDLSERMRAATRAAVLPVGYWHGYPRALSSIGEVLIRGVRAKVLGRVSMDIIVVGKKGLRVRPGDVVTLLGRDGRDEIDVYEASAKIGASHYEFVTRLNPLMERTLVA